MSELMSLRSFSRLCSCSLRLSSSVLSRLILSSSASHLPRSSSACALKPFMACSAPERKPSPWYTCPQSGQGLPTLRRFRKASTLSLRSSSFTSSSAVSALTLASWSCFSRSAIVTVLCEICPFSSSIAPCFSRLWLILAVIEGTMPSSRASTLRLALTFCRSCLTFSWLLCEYWVLILCRLSRSGLSSESILPTSSSFSRITASSVLSLSATAFCCSPHASASSTFPASFSKRSLSVW